MLFYLLVWFEKTNNYFLQYYLRYLLLAKLALLNLQVLSVCYYFIQMELQMMPLFKVAYAHPNQTYFLENQIIIYQELMKLCLVFMLIAFYLQTFLRNHSYHPRLLKMVFFLLDKYHHYLLISFLIISFSLNNQVLFTKQIQV